MMVTSYPSPVSCRVSVEPTLPSPAMIIFISTSVIEEEWSYGKNHHITGIIAPLREKRNLFPGNGREKWKKTSEIPKILLHMFAF